MEKIIIIGCSGSGKSYFARRLRDITGLPLYYMDCIFWKENWNHLTRDELIEELKKIINTDKWIIDGNYTGTLEMRIKNADTVFFLDMPIEKCLEQEASRRGKKREDLPNYLKEEYDPEFIEFIKSFPTKGKVIIEELLDKYKDKNIIRLTSNKEKEEYLEKLAKVTLGQ